MEMQGIFGGEDSKAYRRFIDQHFGKGAEAIIQLWVESHSE